MHMQQAAESPIAFSVGLAFFKIDNCCARCILQAIQPHGSAVAKAAHETRSTGAYGLDTAPNQPF